MILDNIFGLILNYLSSNLEMVINYAFLFAIMIFLIIFISKNKKNVSVEKFLWYVIYFVMYRTKRGLKLIDNIAKKYKKTVKVFAVSGVIAGFIGMGFITVFFIKGFIDFLLSTLNLMPSYVSPMALVLPFPVKGAVFVPPIYWILSIIILAVFHEGAHGIIARKNNIKLHSTGFAILGVIAPILPAAFVEPDEKSLQKKSPWQQIEMYSAGPFANIILFGVFFLIFSLISSSVLAPINVAYQPMANVMYSYNSVEFVDYFEKDYSPAYLNSIPINTSYVKINGVAIFESGKNNFEKIISNSKPGDVITLESEEGSIYNLVLSAHPNKLNSKEKPALEGPGFLGVTLRYQGEEFSFGSIFKDVLVKFLMGLFFWLALLNIGVGLFNLLPMGPLDGGRILLTTFTKFFGEKKAKKINKIITWVLFIMFLLLLISSFIK